jgi:anti-sigma regulatory factor (Ser/Thr protein kinase)
MNQAIALLQEVAQQDLEQCEAAIRAADQGAAIEAIERVFAKLDTAIDMLRSAPSERTASPQL